MEAQDQLHQHEERNGMEELQEVALVISVYSTYVRE